MLQLVTPAELRQQLQKWRQRGQTLALVPTMGHLHAGHFALIELAKQQAAKVIVSIFVNPAQFAAGEDFARYPRTLADDLSKLSARGVHAVFTPEHASIYPNGVEQHTRVHVPILETLHCGATRPKHFSGVATIVLKLFNLIQPDVAIFGEKDYQQLLLIRQMSKDLALSVQIVAHPTVREADGLALSSRNIYLTAEQRRQAPLLYQCLQSLVMQIQSDAIVGSAQIAAAIADLEHAGLRVEYLRLCDPATLGAVSGNAIRIIAAVWLGDIRLIDNIEAHSGH